MGHDLDDEELKATKLKLRNLYRNYDYKNIMKEAKKFIERENKIKYNFIKREIKIGSKLIKLGRLENRFIACMWFSKRNLATYKTLNKRVYGYRKIDYIVIHKLAYVLRKKGIPIKNITRIGYQLKSI